MKLFVTFYQVLILRPRFISILYNSFLAVMLCLLLLGFDRIPQTYFFSSGPTNYLCPLALFYFEKKSSKQGKKENCYLMRKKKLQNLSRCFNLRKHSSPNKGPSSLKETGSNSPDSPAHILYILHYKAVILSKRLYKVTS